MDMRPLLRGAAIALVGVTLTSCSSGSDGGTAPGGGTGPGAAGGTITIKDFGFGSPLTVGPGATVTVKQEDAIQHDVFSDAFKTSLLTKGQSDMFTAPAKPGTYDFTCSIPPQMHGQLIVKAGASSTSTDDSSPGGY